MDLHIVSFDIPSPPNYGGIIDVYFKLRALAENGVRIRLHCYEYGRAKSKELEDICEEVHYYPRKKIRSSLPLRFPHIVSSRKSSALLEKLQYDSFPILFEGLHTCYFLDHTYLKYRQKWVRMHNIEWEYYFQLSQREPSWTKRQYYLRESQLLEQFEKRLTLANGIFSISPRDQQYFEKQFINAVYLPAFHPNDTVSILEGKGSYCLYHGNLAVAENHEAALFLIHSVFSELEIPLRIAGSHPQPELITAINEYDHITLIHNPGEGEMLELVRKAHINVLPSFQPTGIKLKLLKALFNGRFCLVSPDMVKGNGLGKYCLIAQNTEEFKALVLRLFKYRFSPKEIDSRAKLLETDFNNTENAKKLIETIKSSD